MSSAKWLGMAPRPSTPTRSLSNGRAPSQEAQERSMHNDSGHGKSTEAIVRDIKASNAKLSRKTADMEAEFMNQVNEMTTGFNNREKALQEAIAAKEEQIATMEARMESTENRIRERDGQLAKLKEETTFQRHTIADLKNQLYQLQHEIEDAEYDKRDEVDKWAIEKKDMKREMELLRAQVNAKGNDSKEIMQNWKQLEEAKEELEGTRKRLHDAQSSLANLEQDKKRLQRDLEEKDVLKKELADRDKVISSLRDEVTKYSSQVAQLTVEVAEIKADSVTQNNYHQEEAEDLRVVNESLREDLNRLRADLEDMGHELDEKDEVLSEKNNEITGLRQELEVVARDFKNRLAGENESSEQLAEEMESVRNECVKLRAELKSAAQKHEREIEKHQKQIHFLTSDKEEIMHKLEQAEIARDAARVDLEKGAQQQQDVSRAEKRLREIVAKAARDREELEQEFEARLASVEQSYQKKINLLNNRADSHAPELQALRNELTQKKFEIESLQDQLRRGGLGSMTAEQTSELHDLREKVRVLEARNAGTERAKKQLREAQIALVALDDEKTLLEKQYKEKLVTLESQKNELERDHKAHMLQKEAELVQLRERDATSSTSDYVAEIEKLKAEIKDKEELLNSTNSTSEAQEKLQSALSAARQELVDQRKLLRQKLEDRDTTIASLVKSSVAQEQKVTTLKQEVASLKAQLQMDGPSQEMEAVRKAREAEYVEEIENLRAAIEENKDVERRLLTDLSTLERKLVEIEVENRRLKEYARMDPSLRGSLLLTDHEGKVQERDVAIAALVKQSMALEEQLNRVKVENAELRLMKDSLSSNQNQSGPNWSELRRLHKESEIFAGQIIEQDEEIEKLRSKLADRESRVSFLEKELANVKRKATSLDRDMDKIADLQAELDELQEANSTQRAEVRDLRKQLREAKTHSNELQDLRAELDQTQRALEEAKSKVGSNERDDKTWKRQLEALQVEKEEMETKFSQQMDSMRRQRNAAVEALEEKIKEKDALIEDLKQNDRLLVLEKEVKKLSKDLFEKSEMLEDAQISNKQLRNMLDERKNSDELAKGEEERKKLSQEVVELKKQMKEFESDRVSIEDIKNKLAAATEEREELENRLVESYERKMSILKLDKDVTIDNLRKDLIETKAVRTENTEDMMKHIEALERANKDIIDECEAKLQLKNTKIHALEQTLGAQEQLVDNMRAEMDQLQGQMERISLSRRAEIEEMQQEMIDTSSKAQRQEREITSLKMALEESRLDHKAEVTKLKEQMESMKVPYAPEPPVNITHRSEKLDDFKERLESLKWRNTSLQEENQKLRKRLEKVENEVQGRRAQSDLTSEMQDEIQQLRQHIKDLEDEKTSKLVSIAGIPRSPSVPRPTAILSPSQRTRKSSSESQRKPQQQNPLRFLKRKTSSGKEEQEQSPGKVSTDDSSSSASKLTF
jgi:chromosome segregation ATPase